jgi:hypothetical protein
MNNRTTRGAAISAVSGCVVIIGVVALVMPGCYGRACDGDDLGWGPSSADIAAVAMDAGTDAELTRTHEGHLTNPDTWESNDINADWVPYLHEQKLHVEYPQLGARQPDQITAYISADQNPNKLVNGAPESNFTVAGGNVAKFVGVYPGTATILNDTCADFYVRVVVHASP